MQGLTVIVVEDEALVAEVIGEQLAKAGCRVLATTDTGEGAIEAVTRLDPDVVLMDVKLKGDLDGVQAAKCIQEWRRVPVVFATAYSDRATRLRAESAGAIGFVPKPFDLESFRTTIRTARDRRQLQRRR